MPNPATVDDIVDRWRPLTAQEATNARVILEDAWWLLLGHRPGLEAAIAADPTVSRNVVRVVTAIALRVLKNPDGFIDESVDDWRGRRSDLTSSGVLHVTPSELADVAVGRKQLRSVRLVNCGDV